MGLSGRKCTTELHGGVLSYMFFFNTDLYLMTMTIVWRLSPAREQQKSSSGKPLPEKGLG